MKEEHITPSVFLDLFGIDLPVESPVTAFLIAITRGKTNERVRLEHLYSFREQVTEITPTPENASLTGTNVSQTGASIVDQTGEAAQGLVNKTTSVLGNITGEILGK